MSKVSACAMVLHESPQDRHTQNGVSLSIISPTPRASPSPLQWTEKVSPPILLRLPVPVRLSAAKGIFLDANMVWSRHSSEPSRDPPTPTPWQPTALRTASALLFGFQSPTLSGLCTLC